jgi:hypothetical protein
MSDCYLLLTPLLVLGVLALAGFVGCDKVFGLNHFSIDLPLVVGETLMTPRNDFTGWVGMAIVPLGADQPIYAIGRYCVPGNTGNHAVKIVDASGNDVPGSTTNVNLAGQTANQFVYAAVSGITLKANLKYYVVSYETTGGDQFFDFATTLVLSSDNFFSVPSAAFGDPTASPSIPYTETGGPNNSYGPVDIHYGKAD